MIKTFSKTPTIRRKYTIKRIWQHRTARQKLTEQLDQLLHDIVILRDKACVICGANTQLQAGHLFTRSYGRVKYDLLNVHCQCRSHNFLHEHKPDIFTKWFLDKFGKQAYDDLYTEAHKPREPIKPWQLQETYDQLLTIKKTLE
jgi:uncharacterized protein YjiS (DUF1127 family)